jgi:hypothetical protein
MSKTTYGAVAFKQRFAEGVSDADIVLAGRKLAQEIDEVLRNNGAEYSTVSEVMAQATSDQPRIKGSSFKDAAQKGEGEEE